MSWLDIAVCILIGLVAAGTLLVGVWMLAAIIVIYWRHRGDPCPAIEPEAAGDDDTMAVADAVAEQDGIEVHRSHPWGDGRPWRASEEWLAGAVEAYDWAAAETAPTRKPVR
jgi:hypothetical protein